MSDYAIAGVGLALLSLIWSDLPFIQLVYMLSVINVVDWNQWGVVTGFYLIASIGANIAKRIGK